LAKKKQNLTVFFLRTSVWGFFYALRQNLSNITENKKALMQFLSDADIAIDDIEWEEEEIHLPDALREKFAKRDIVFPIMRTNVIFKRKDNEGNFVAFDMDEDESEGTKKLYRLFPLWEQMAKSRNLLCYDELEEALHPNLLEFLLRCIARLPETCGSQLIFTTHNVEILEMNVLRRDCVWFTEKDAHHASDLYELSSFDSIRPSTLIKKLYLHGKFGAVPRVPLEY
jgi:uncharacterized protein